MSDIEAKFAGLGDQFTNVFPLNRTELLITLGGHSIRILGCTLWSHIPDDAMVAVTTLLNDYKLIYTSHIGHGDKSTVRVTFNDMNTMHARDRQWLESRLINDGTPTVVLTHYAPLMVGTSSPEYETRATNHGFATDLSAVFTPNLRLWAFGHTHWACDLVYQNTRIVTNARGYTSSERKGYVPDKVFVVNLVSNTVLGDAVTAGQE